MWLPDRQRFANYLRPDELHAAFNFDFLGCAWDAAALRESIDGTLSAHAPVNAPATWVLSNHDVTRHVTRYGRADTRFSFAAKREGIPTDLELGTRRARAAALLSLSLPGAAYIYQGEELGLYEVEDIPYALRQDPMWERSGRIDPGRDGCRVPLPWAGDEPPFEFSPEGAAAPWLPQPADWKDRTASAQTGDSASMLELYRAAIQARQAEPALGDGELTWLPAPDGVLAFSRGGGFTCLVNLSAVPVPMPAQGELLLASGPLDDGLLPADTAVWLRTGESAATDGRPDLTLLAVVPAARPGRRHHATKKGEPRGDARHRTDTGGPGLPDERESAAHGQPHHRHRDTTFDTRPGQGWPPSPPPCSPPHR